MGTHLLGPSHGLEGKFHLCTCPYSRRTVLTLHGHLRKLKRRWKSQKSNPSIVIRRSKLSWRAPKELKLPKKMQAERDEWLKLADYS